MELANAVEYTEYTTKVMVGMAFGLGYLFFKKLRGFTDKQQDKLIYSQRNKIRSIEQKIKEMYPDLYSCESIEELNDILAGISFKDSEITINELFFFLERKGINANSKTYNLILRQIFIDDEAEAYAILDSLISEAKYNLNETCLNEESLVIVVNHLCEKYKNDKKSIDKEISHFIELFKDINISSTYECDLALSKVYLFQNRIKESLEYYVKYSQKNKNNELLKDIINQGINNPIKEDAFLVIEKSEKCFFEEIINEEDILNRVNSEYMLEYISKYDNLEYNRLKFLVNLLSDNKEEVSIQILSKNKDLSKESFTLLLSNILSSEDILSNKSLYEATSIISNLIDISLHHKLDELAEAVLEFYEKSLSNFPDSDEDITKQVMPLYVKMINGFSDETKAYEMVLFLAKTEFKSFLDQNTLEKGIYLMNKLNKYEEILEISDIFNIDELSIKSVMILFEIIVKTHTKEKYLQVMNKIIEFINKVDSSCSSRKFIDIINLDSQFFLEVTNEYQTNFYSNYTNISPYLDLIKLERSKILEISLNYELLSNNANKAYTIAEEIIKRDLTIKKELFEKMIRLLLIKGLEDRAMALLRREFKKNNSISLSLLESTMIVLIRGKREKDLFDLLLFSLKKNIPLDFELIEASMDIIIDDEREIKLPFKTDLFKMIKEYCLRSEILVDRRLLFKLNYYERIDKRSIPTNYVPYNPYNQNNKKQLNVVQHEKVIFEQSKLSDETPSCITLPLPVKNIEVNDNYNSNGVKLLNNQYRYIKEDKTPKKPQIYPIKSPKDAQCSLYDSVMKKPNFKNNNMVKKSIYDM